MVRSFSEYCKNVAKFGCQPLVTRRHCTLGSWEQEWRGTVSHTSRGLEEVSM